MKTLMLLAALCLVLCVVVPQTEGVKCLKYRVTTCRLVYLKGCGWYRVCVVYHRTVCYHKRDQIENDKGKVKRTNKGPEKAILEMFPCKFSDFDKDGDKRITFKEFQTTLGDVKDVYMLRKVFNATDKNGDKVITCDEFLKAEFGFSCKPVCQ